MYVTYITCYWARHRVQLVGAHIWFEYNSLEMRGYLLLYMSLTVTYMYGSGVCVCVGIWSGLHSSLSTCVHDTGAGEAARSHLPISHHLHLPRWDYITSLPLSAYLHMYMVHTPHSGSILSEGFLLWLSLCVFFIRFSEVFRWSLCQAWSGL